MDFNVRMNKQQSEINGLYQEVEELKNERKKLKEKIDTKTDKIISQILNHGKVIAYKNNEPHVLLVRNSKVTKFDKSQLADDLGVTQKDLDLIGVAELVEEKRVTAVKLKEYEYDEDVQKLKARKATKADMELILS